MTTFSRSLSPLARLRVTALLVLGFLLSVPPAARRRCAAGRDAGMSTAEYAVGTVAAVAFAAVLYKVVRSAAVSSALSSILEGALGITL